MNLKRAILHGAAVAVAFALFAVQRVDGDIIIFPDGFAIEGKVGEKFEVMFTPDGAFSVPKAGEPFWLDDGVRKIYFPPSQLKEAIKDKIKKPDLVTFSQYVPVSKGELPMNWTTAGATDWDGRWERQVTLQSSTGNIKSKQRIVLMTPDRIRIDGVTHNWQCYYNTREFDPDVLRRLLFAHLSTKKEPDLEARIKVYRFLLQAGFTEHAGKELDDLLRDFPKEKSSIEPLLNNINRIYAVQVVQALERSQKAGMHEDVEQKLAWYAKNNAGNKLDDLLDEKTQLQVQVIKDKHGAIKEKLKEAKRLLAVFTELTPPSQRAFFKDAADAMVKELNADTVDRYDTFLNLAADYERAVKDKRNPEQSPADVMAFALTGCLRGSDAAEGNALVAMKQWEGRQLMLQYLRTDDELARRKLLPALKAKIGVDEAMQILRFLPPVAAATNLGPQPQELKTLNDGKQFNYTVQLPPGYNHGRSWPVLIALHHSLEKSASAVASWAALAAEHGYIVVAPQWSKNPGAGYQYSSQENQAVLETLQDLRRRFQIDSDRVFLFGPAQGGNMAFDVGLAHPDQFAGVMPMSCIPAYFARRYWSNGQYLNFYIVNGDRAEFSSQQTMVLFKDSIRFNYPAIYVEYKGRPAEWFGAERTILFDWMDRKRRAHPLKELGRENVEFKTQRTSDNMFYWLSTNDVFFNNLNTAAGWDNTRKPATLRATVSSKNEINIRTTGVGQVTVWFVPKLVDFSEKVSIRINGVAMRQTLVTPNLDTLLETLYQTGDRQRLFLARLDFKA